MQLTDKLRNLSDELRNLFYELRNLFDLKQSDKYMILL